MLKVYEAQRRNVTSHTAGILTTCTSSDHSNFLVSFTASVVAVSVMKKKTRMPAAKVRME